MTLASFFASAEGNVCAKCSTQIRFGLGFANCQLLIAGFRITSQRRNQKQFPKRRSIAVASRWTERRNPPPFLTPTLRWLKTCQNTTFMRRIVEYARCRSRGHLREMALRPRDCAPACGSKALSFVIHHPSLLKNPVSGWAK